MSIKTYDKKCLELANSFLSDYCDNEENDADSLAKEIQQTIEDFIGDREEHQYTERTTAPLGVKCIKCGHFVGAWET